MSRSVVGLGSLLLVVGLVVGCGKRASQVSGVVTYEGAALQTGFISFTPVDGAGGTTASPIVRGRYKVEDLSPGKWRVEIRAGTEVASMPDMDAPKPRADGKGGARPQAKVEEELVPPDAEGNNETVDIRKGVQKLDFPLERPRRKKAEPPPAPAPRK